MSFNMQATRLYYPELAHPNGLLDDGSDKAQESLLCVSSAQWAT